ncbi:MAG: sigma-70 family RNA polymerase sigma factor, partial [Planctomycetes bacterium]|nr:sigma-70 family RNA polymerase sigma factor [Planctomycetota bacterium]
MRRYVRDGSSLSIYRKRLTLLGRWEGFPSTLPILCQELYYRYCMEYTEEAFERFYHSTMPVFFSYAVERCQEGENRTDPLEIVIRLYGVLVSHAMNRRRVPFRALFSWCFGVINNLIQEEQRFRKKLPSGSEGLERCESGEDPLEAMISAEEIEKRDQSFRELLGFIEQPNRLLTKRERSVMEMFYCRDLPLKEISRKLSIKRDHVGVILFRARRRLISYFQGRRKMKRSENQSAEN